MYWGPSSNTIKIIERWLTRWCGKQSLETFSMILRLSWYSTCYRHLILNRIKESSRFIIYNWWYISTYTDTYHYVELMTRRSIIVHYRLYTIINSINTFKWFFFFLLNKYAGIQIREIFNIKLVKVWNIIIIIWMC